ncbi:hypothetical protein GOP47_0010848 [Adiantum capillus-veneris]|uniref:Uncharacterized protein n=1 Tax=Adiantum capillus-veneris TaxID=13818 RepID=A0A9D4ZI74_ADICA|nr:hypothetical protein GOP47_0010848 [Adiantum capillus-veneris]
MKEALAAIGSSGELAVISLDRALWRLGACIYLVVACGAWWHLFPLYFLDMVVGDHPVCLVCACKVDMEIGVVARPSWWHLPLGTSYVCFWMYLVIVSSLWCVWVAPCKAQSYSCCDVLPCNLVVTLFESLHGPC